MNYKAALNVTIRDVGDSAVWGLRGAIETMTMLVSIPLGWHSHMSSSPNDNSQELWGAAAKGRVKSCSRQQ